MLTECKGKALQEVIYDADHAFEVATVPLQLPNGAVVPDKMATVRKDTGAYLGTVGQGYEIVQPQKFYELADAFMRETGATINGAVTLKNSAVIGLSLCVDTREYLPGDPVRLNFLMVTSFNMRYSIIGRALSVRLFCLNQLPSSSSLFDIKHTRYAEPRLDMALRMIAYYYKEQIRFDQWMKSLVKYPMSERVMIAWFTDLFPNPKGDSKRGSTILDNNVETFTRLLSEGAGVNVPGLKGTGYHALNALTEYVNHHRSTRVKNGRKENEVKWESTLFGSGNALMQKGFGRLIEMVKTEPSGKYIAG